MPPREPTLKAVWNMDEAILKTIHYLKTEFILKIHKWQLEEAYWTLRDIRMEIDSKLKGEEQKTAKNELNELEKRRKDYLKDKKKEKGKFYVACEQYYILLNRYMKIHGLYFRESDDPRYAVLQR